MPVDKNLGPSTTPGQAGLPDKGVVIQSGTTPKPTPHVGGYARE